MDQDTFERLVERFYRPLYRFALSLTRSEADACDLVQETYRRLAAKGHQLRDESKAKTWLFTTLYRRFIDSWKWRSKFHHIEIESAEMDLPNTEHVFGEGLDRAAMLQALDAVDEIYRVPLTLFYLQEHSYREIAEILDVPTGTIMSRIARGRDALRRMLIKPEDRTGRGPLSDLNLKEIVVP